MADGIAGPAACTALDSTFPNTCFAQLHVGAPGAAGTSNPAGETTRSAIGTLTAAAVVSNVAGKSNSAAINWTSVTTAETYSHVSIWSAATSGTFLGSGAITASAVAVGDNFQIPIGDLTITQPVAS